MKKIIVGVVLTFLFASPLSATEVFLGPKIGLGDYSEIGGDWSSISKPNGWENNFAMSFTGGMFLNTRFREFFGVQLETIFRNRNLQYQQGDYDYNEIINSFCVPLYLRFNIDLGGVGLYLMAGPQLDILFDKVKLKDSYGAEGDYRISTASNLNRYLYSISAGLGLSFPTGNGFVDLGMGYTQNLNRFNSSWDGYFYGITLDLGYGFRLGDSSGSSRKGSDSSRDNPLPTNLEAVLTVEEGLEHSAEELFSISKNWMDDEVSECQFIHEDDSKGIIVGQYTAKVHPPLSPIRAYSADFVFKVSEGSASLQISNAAPATLTALNDIRSLDNFDSTAQTPGVDLANDKHRQKVKEDMENKALRYSQEVRLLLPPSLYSGSENPDNPLPLFPDLGTLWKPDPFAPPGQNPFQ